MTIWALVPLKSFDHAKQRLADRLDPQQRSTLAAKMAASVIAALRAEPLIAGVAVISADAAVLQWAQRYGALPIVETGSGLNAALEQGAKTLAGIGATTLLVVPGDLPLIETSDLRHLLGRIDARRVVIVPAIRDGGTNALLLTPPLALRFAFGFDSARVHATAALKLDLVVERLELASFGLDIDVPSDLERLCERMPGLFADLPA